MCDIFLCYLTSDEYYDNDVLADCAINISDFWCWKLIIMSELCTYDEWEWTYWQSKKATRVDNVKDIWLLISQI